MSSSRRSSLSRKSQKPRICPTCGAKRVVAVTEGLSVMVRGKRYRIEDAAHERCEACGERILGLELARRFDMVVPRRKRRRVA